MKNGRGQFSAKIKYFFDLLNNITISSKLRGGQFFYSLDTFSYAEHGQSRKNFRKKFQKNHDFWRFLGHCSSGFDFRAKRSRLYTRKWGLEIDWDHLELRISLGWGARSKKVCSQNFTACEKKFAKTHNTFSDKLKGDYIF